MTTVLINKCFRFFALTALLWLIVTYGFGINIPLLTKTTPSPNTLKTTLKLPQDFTIEVFASNLPGIRTLLPTPTGALIATLPKQGQVILLKKTAANSKASQQATTLLSGLNLPSGLAFYKNWLYIAESHAIGRIHYDPIKQQISGDYTIIINNLPDGGNHWTRTIKFSPNGKLFIAVGSSCNVCEEDHHFRASLLTYHPDGSHGEIYATGLRNTVGFAWEPNSQRLFGVDNGRDFLGDDTPPDEINWIQKGHFYGWPYSHSNNHPDPQYGSDKSHEVARSTPPYQHINAHSAPLSILFLKHPRFPPHLRQKALITLHGSWNRSTKTGYKIIAVDLKTPTAIRQQDFITGFETQGDVIGRPVDLVEDHQGDLFLSDDFSGTVYKITYPPDQHR
ncbi:MAG TPA: sorbosone dehydrogenase family protein [Methylococcaceae bacterium]|nr:sorbosone dehydrogenase family protein [Methylococcaceae bacterium]HIL41022.1 sorbosone dehydrogenase family protein [Methylococcales bacterium]